MIYCVEDNTEIRELVVYTLQMTGFTARGFVDGKDFFAAIKEELPELVLLDIMLPGEDGLQILKKLRASEATRHSCDHADRKTTEYDKVIGLDSGADDYLTKPFGMMELIARIKAVLRRASVAEESDEITIGPLVVYRDEHRVFNNGVEVALTPKEFSLLLYLIENRGIVLTRERLLSEVWGFDYYGKPERLTRIFDPTDEVR